MCNPVRVAGRTTGVVHLQGPLDEPPPSAAVWLELLARKAGERIGALRILATTEAQARADPLTGLPNRRAIENRVHELIARDTPFVVAFADLDHFKRINDTHGHETGDRALRLFARVLRDNVRPGDHVARYGGEEFLAVLPACSVADAAAAADRIRSALSGALRDAAVPRFTVSLGIAAAEPGDAFTDVVVRADSAMLQAKALGRDRIVIAGTVPSDDVDPGVGDDPAEGAPDPPELEPARTR